MLYVKLTENYSEYFDEECKFSEFIKKIIFLFRKIFGILTNRKVNNGEVLLIPKYNKKFKNELIQYFKIYNVKVVCISRNLKNTDICESINELGIKILDGKWLYKYLIQEISNYTVFNKKAELKTQELSFLINKITEVDIQNILDLSEKCKNINIITNEENKLKNIENNLYKEKGIILNITNNYKKSLLKSDIIINMDFSEEEFNKYIIPRKAVIINLNHITIQKKGFDGISVLGYKIIFPKHYENSIININSFDREILYESYVYKNTSPKNILKKLKEDKIIITNLIGLKGEINKKEFLKL